MKNGISNTSTHDILTQTKELLSTRTQHTQLNNSTNKTVPSNDVCLLENSYHRSSQPASQPAIQHTHSGGKTKCKWNMHLKQQHQQITTQYRTRLSDFRLKSVAMLDFLFRSICLGNFIGRLLVVAYYSGSGSKWQTNLISVLNCHNSWVLSFIFTTILIVLIDSLRPLCDSSCSLVCKEETHHSRFWSVRKIEFVAHTHLWNAGQCWDSSAPYPCLRTNSLNVGFKILV